MIDLSSYLPGKRPTVTGLDTVEQALAALEAAVATRGGDYVYPVDDRPACVYVELEPKLKPSCLIGCVLTAHGVPLEWFATPTPSGWDRNSDGINITGQDLGIADDVVHVLKAAQRCQDRGSSWAQALNEARAAATENHALADAVA